MKLILLLLMFVTTQAGDLSGKVIDSQGAALRSARVSVRNQSGFIVRETLTGEQGEFRIEGLEPGIYFVAVDAEGLIQTNGPQEIKARPVRRPGSHYSSRSERGARLNTGLGYADGFESSRQCKQHLCGLCE